MLEGGRSIFQLALNKYPHAFQRPVTRQAISTSAAMYVHGHRPRKGVALYGDVRDAGQRNGAKVETTRSPGGIRTAKEEDVEDEEREGANGVGEPELTNAKELSGISHLISRATQDWRWYASRRGGVRRSEAWRALNGI